jgi:hypothetical protein
MGGREEERETTDDTDFTDEARGWGKRVGVRGSVLAYGRVGVSAYLDECHRLHVANSERRTDCGTPNVERRTLNAER